MGSAGLIEIRRRMKSIESTRKITKAMGHVATSKLRKLKSEIKINTSYSQLNKEIINEIVNSLPEDYISKYINKKNNSNKLYIVLASNTGLCGGFNNNIIVYLKELIDNKNISNIVIVGKKGVSYLKKIGLKPIEVFSNTPEVSIIKQTNDIYEYIYDKYVNGDICEVNIVYTQFKSQIKQQPIIAKLLPIDKGENKISKYIIEPNIDEVFNIAVNMYIKSKIMNCLINSRASEESSRISAMNGATENADDILRYLNKKFNRIRQSMITQEISEIVGGAEAQK